MKILQIGIPKSGNFWLYKIIDEILISSGQKQLHFIEQHPVYQLAKTWDLNYPEQAQIDVIDITDWQTSYRISSIFRMPADNFENYISKTNHVWTHSPICKRSEEVYSHFDKKIYIIRDPRDRAVSSSIYHCSPYMMKYFPQPEKDPGIYFQKNFETLIKNWVWHVFDHLRLQKELAVHLVFYEGLLCDFQKELNKLLEYLEIELQEKEKTRIEEKLSFRSLKKNNPKHLRKGTYGYWTSYFTQQQREKAAAIAGPLMDVLNYSNLSKDTFFLTPQTSSADYEDLREKLISSQCEV